MQKEQIHIDTETLSTKLKAKLLSIGAVCGEETFYVEIDTSLYPEGGAFISDDKTIQWWADRGGFEPSQEPLSPFTAVSMLAQWIAKVTEDLEWFDVWANSPSFDCEKLNYHFKHYSIAYPWDFWQERCVRTIKNLGRSLNLNIPEGDPPHHALEDARAQQRTVAAVFATLADKCQFADDMSAHRPLDLEINIPEPD